MILSTMNSTIIEYITNNYHNKSLAKYDIVYQSIEMRKPIIGKSIHNQSGELYVSGSSSGLLVSPKITSSKH